MRRFTRRHIAALLIVVLVVSLGAYGALRYAHEHKQEVLQNKVVQLMVPLYRSLRKLPDVLFIPRYAFSKTNLETFELSISPERMERMNAQLPEVPFASGMGEENKLWVGAYFRAPGYEGNVDVRYRGNLAAHWNAYQKSYLVQFPKNNLFRGMRELTLVIPSKRRYFAMSLNNYRAQKLGLLYPEEQYVRLKVNGADTGVLLAFEHWSQEWIEKLPVSSLSSLYGLDEGSDPYRSRWKNWTADEFDPAPLDALVQVVTHADDETFEKIIPQLIDVEDFLKWDVMFILAGGYHVSSDAPFGDNNLVLLFDRAEGRFKPVPYNTVIYTDSFREEVGKEGLLGSPTLLRRRLLAIPSFRAQRDAYVKEYLAEEKEDDIAFIQRWRAQYDREFFMDNAKNDNHFTYLSHVNENEETAIRNFSDPYNALAVEYPISIEEKEALSLPPGYEMLRDTAVLPQTFARLHTRFYFDGERLHLRAGSHIFREDVVIPAGTRLVIAPGTRLIFAPGASLFSYSPISAEGTRVRPIEFLPLTGEPWGVVAVLNTDSEESTFTHTRFEYGGEDVVNGAVVTGMLAAHNADVRITQSVFRNAQGDDGVNVKGGRALVAENVFEQHSSDGIDLDYPLRETVVRNNSFVNNLSPDGDAIDLSWSNIDITGNIVMACGDKGVSVGERSEPNIYRNIIARCAMGIAVKDSSQASIFENILVQNTIPVALYQKKPYFQGGVANIYSNVLSENARDIQTDVLSSFSAEENTERALVDVVFPEWVPSPFISTLREDS